MRSPLILGSQLYIVNKVRYEGFQLVRVELLPVCEGVAEKLLCSAELSEVCLVSSSSIKSLCKRSASASSALM